MGRRSHRRSVARARSLPSALPARMAAAGAIACLILVGAGARGQQPPAPLGAESCTGCHAPAARGTSIPAIDGRPARELAEALHAFRSGQRHATVMDRITKGFTTAELDAIAAWYAEVRR